MNQPKAYSYLRFSTPEQAQGDSYRRQRDLAVAYAQKHDLDLDDELTFSDEGVSAFRGKNAATGALRAFLRHVEDGIIPKGSYLLVESLDRISRDNIVEAQGSFMSIIGMGITLVTLTDNRSYSRESLNQNPTDFIISLLTLIRANEESSTKSRRLKEVWKAKRASAGTKVLTRVVPAWLTVTPEGTIAPIPERVVVVQAIFEAFINGASKKTITHNLNSQKIEPFTFRKTKEVPMWRESYITKILKSEAVIGNLITHTVESKDGRSVRKPHETIKGYYPAIVSDVDFSRAQLLQGTSGTVRAGSREVKNPFAGLARCPKCGRTMTRVYKGTQERAGVPRLVCVGARSKTGCDNFKGIPINHLVWAISHDGGKPLAEFLLAETNEKAAKEIENLVGVEHGLADQIENLLDVVQNGRGSVSINQKIRELETELEKVQAELKTATLAIADSTHLAIKRRVDRLLNAIQEENPAKLSVALRESFKSITLNHETGHLELLSQRGNVLELMYKWVD